MGLSEFLTGGSFQFEDRTVKARLRIEITEIMLYSVLVTAGPPRLGIGRRAGIRK